MKTAFKCIFVYVQEVGYFLIGKAFVVQKPDYRPVFLYQSINASVKFL